MKRAPRPSPYVDYSLRCKFARETQQFLNMNEECQVVNLEMAYGGENWDGEGEVNEFE